ncbi:MAG: L-rhamnose/proton symporter RhaT [Chitinophagaceae bacterium]|nr:L-rhamnose/proton symporter RhaT [Chitinophagaceae bacterium]
MQAILGAIYHLIGGFASGSFYMPYKKVHGWQWESFWLTGGLFSWLIVPPVAAWLTLPGFHNIIGGTAPAVLGAVFLMGLLWGVGGLTYGLGVRYLGMSLGNSVILGFCSAFGALIPPVYYNLYPSDGKTSLTDMFATPGGRMVLLGVLVCLIGIAICGRAGILKERDLQKEEKKNNGNEFSLLKGLIIASVSGILSAFFNYGIEAGKSMAEEAVKAGANPLFQNNVIFVVILWGGLTTNFAWCIFLNIRNRSFKDYSNKATPLFRNYIFCAMAGTLWFLQFFFYGMGESKLGNGASSWILHMAFIILTANVWGIVLKEWKGTSPKTIRTITIGILSIMLSVILVGYGNSIM